MSKAKDRKGKRRKGKGRKGKRRKMQKMPLSKNFLLLYFERRWINGSVPMRMWNFFDVDHRTNNTSEGALRKVLLVTTFQFDVASFFVLFQRIIFDSQRDCRKNIQTYGVLFNSSNTSMFDSSIFLFN